MFPDVSLFDCQSDRQTLSLLEDIYNPYSKTRAALALGVLGSIPSRILWPSVKSLCAFLPSSAKHRQCTWKHKAKHCHTPERAWTGTGRMMCLCLCSSPQQGGSPPLVEHYNFYGCKGKEIKTGYCILASDRLSSREMLNTRTDILPPLKLWRPVNVLYYIT